jgi:hypothetical protein
MSNGNPSLHDADAVDRVLPAVSCMIELHEKIYEVGSHSVLQSGAKLQMQSVSVTRLPFSPKSEESIVFGYSCLGPWADKMAA